PNRRHDEQDGQLQGEPSRSSEDDHQQAKEVEISAQGQLQDNQTIAPRTRGRPSLELAHETPELGLDSQGYPHEIRRRRFVGSPPSASPTLGCRSEMEGTKQWAERQPCPAGSSPRSSPPPRDCRP